MRTPPLPIVVPVAGVSFHPDTVAELREGDTLVIEHDPANEYDQNACAVKSRSGLVGHLPREIAARMVAGPDRRWTGQVDQLLKGDKATGVRVRILAADDTAAGPASAPPPVTADQPAAAHDHPTANAADTPAPADAPLVTARSGRILGRLAGTTADKTLVLTDAGVVPYPSDLVRVQDPTAAP